MWVLPEYRQLNVAPIIMQAMEELCNEHDVEGYCEFVRMSHGVGVKSGFEEISKVCLKIKIENPTKESQELIDDFQSEPLYLMVRPKKSDKNSASRPTFVGPREPKL